MISCAAFSSACAWAAQPAPEVIEVEDFRRANMTDRQVIAVALQAWQQSISGVLRFARGRTYHLGSVSKGPDLFVITGLKDAVLDGNGAVIRATSVNDAVWNCFSFSGIHGLRIANLAFRDAGYRGEATGMKALVFQPGMLGCRRIELTGVRGTGLLSMVQAQGPFLDTARVSDIRFVAGCEAADCYYALCCQNQGDAISGRLDAVRCRRPYLVYGVERHDLAMAIHDEAGRDIAPARSPVLIKAYDRPTRDMRLQLRFFGETPARGFSDADPGSCVTIEVQGSSQRQAPVSDIDLTIDVTGAARSGFHPALLRLSTMDAAGRPLDHPVGVFSAITVNVQSARNETIFLPRGMQHASSVRFGGDISALRLIAVG